MCGVLAELSSGSGENPSEIVANSQAALTSCIERCFCKASGVYTGDMSESGRPLVRDSEQHFGYDAVDLESLAIPVARLQPLSPPSSTLPVYRYSVEDQARLCGEVMQRLAEPRRGAAAGAR